MKLVFMSNYMNHYQLPLAQDFIKVFGDGYRFIAMTPFNEERISSGWHNMNDYPFVIRAYESPQAMKEALDTAEQAEYLIIGGTPMDMELVNRRAMNHKITFEYTERIFKSFTLGSLRWMITSRISPKRRSVLRRRLLGSTPPPISTFTYYVQEHLFREISGFWEIIPAEPISGDIFLKSNVMMTLTDSYLARKKIA